MKHERDFSFGVLYIALKNVAAIAFFIYLAMFFKIWWIALFSIVFQSSYKKTDDVKEVEPSNILHCDCCGEILFVNDIEDAVHTDMKNKRWRRLEVGGKWRNYCPCCVDKYFPSKKIPVDQ